MTAVTAEDFISSSPQEEIPPVKPVWLRPAAITFAVLAHASLFLALVMPHDDPPPTPLDAVEVSLVQQGSVETEAAAAPVSDPTLNDQELAEVQTPTATAQPQVAALAAEAAIKEVEDAIAIPVAQPDPLPMTTPTFMPPPEPVPQQQKAETVPVKEKPPEVKPEKKKVEKRRAPQSAERAPVVKTGAARAQRAGVEDGAEAVTGQARATYGALVLAELHRRQFYPPAARAEGLNGNVGVVFTIGASGRVTSHSITRSSGHPALDAAAHQMLQSVQAPPPPGGSFSGSTTIRFSLNH
ncbi:energy transducer TonB [Beijerinckia indica]|uniref:Protein TonB n=1 Tax=Beijerinckia indica subsp. indica (strain ATCC 9039 / DSM 1715 / NCIMB 8712) TaxID=395963 RepID=B2IG27_BEII9|nr:energy transducer TonB [Beijerinckia indica]ACB95764.1 TonB family protein [Beijerinckia indica subsp. indica ATCC 9039]